MKQNLKKKWRKRNNNPVFFMVMIKIKIIIQKMIKTQVKMMMIIQMKMMKIINKEIKK